MKQLCISLTNELLAKGVFSHLSDDELSRLHYILMQLQLKNYSDNYYLDKAIDFWYKGDFFDTITSYVLLQRINAILTSIGRPAIDELLLAEQD